MKISNRLQEIADFIAEKDTVIDVGCDHGLLGVYLLKQGKCKHIINTDISASALKGAKKNAKKYQVEKNISFFVADGLSNISYKKEDTIVLTGMGAHTIVKILQKEKIKFQTLIIGAQKNIPYLRKELVKMGYIIDAEKAIFDKKWYIIMRCKEGIVHYEEIDYILGPFAKNNEVYKKAVIQKEKEISKKRKQKTPTLILLENQKNL